MRTPSVQALFGELSKFEVEQILLIVYAVFSVSHFLFIVLLRFRLNLPLGGEQAFWAVLAAIHPWCHGGEIDSILQLLHSEKREIAKLMTILKT